MEQQLVERLKNGTVDEIDMDMIASRCWAVTKELYKLVMQFERGLREITENHKEELKLAQIAIVAGMTDLSDRDECGFRCAIGSKENIDKVVASIMKEVQ